MIRLVSTSIVALLLATPLTKAQNTPADVLADPALDLNRPADRAKAVAKIKAIEDARAAKTRAKAKALGLQIRTGKPDGGVKEIVDFEGDRPIYLETKNVDAAISTAANLVQASPYGLDGTGIITGVWDSGAVRSTHQEFSNGNRVTIMDGSAPIYHSTHVGGTIGAQGTNASAKGMAPNVSIVSYDWSSDASEMTSWAATGPNQFNTKIYLSNHSYGDIHGWDGNVWTGNGTDQNAADHSFGQYESQSRTLDALFYGAPYYTAFWGAGNDNNNNPYPGMTVTIGGASVAYNPAIHPPGDGVYRNGFETIASYGIAKNIITIGAVNDAVTSGSRDPSQATLTSYSSTGPTDDGRIKPDLVANGTGLTSTATSNDTSYGSMSGTSAASPNATGSAVLVVDQYKRLFNSAMRASTLKALLIHTATDIGNPGPDYKYGWGLVDTKKAVDLIRDHHANPGKTRIIEDQVLASGTTRTYSFLWDGVSPLSATLCWTDPAGTAISTHDSRTSTLVNNLNLKLIAPNGTEYFPYVMPFVGTWTVASMNENATTGINNTDNTETVDIQSPGQTGTWQAVVSCDGAVTNNTQAFGLILSGTANTPNLFNIVSPNGGETFYRSSSYPISWVSNVTGNVSIELLKGGSLHSVLSASNINNGSFTWLVPSTLPTGSDYAIRIKSVSNPSYTDTSAATFTITANPWGNALDTTDIPWDSPGGTPWFSQTTVTKDGVDAVRSGAIDHNGSTSLGATITGPGTLTFWWKVSSESPYDCLKFELNGVEQTGSLARISGEVGWEQKTVTIPAATTTLRWTYSKDGSVSRSSDAAWVDQVVWSPSPAPEIVVEQPVGTDLTDGSSSIHFGSFYTGNSSSPFTFTIRNTGNADLTGLALSKSGAHSADYTLGSLGATTLAPGASTTFTATFSPGAVGTRTATIQIANNDSNESPFDINLTGTGLVVGTLDVTAGGLASTGTYGGPFSPNTKTYTLTNIGTTAIDWTAAKTQSWVTLSATSGTLDPGASTTLTVSINSEANSLNAGSYSDTITFTNTTNGNGSTTRTADLTVNPIPATVSLGNLLQYHDGFPKPVSVTTTPSNLAHTVTYNGSSTVPSGAGTYAVVATITAPNYAGSASGNLIIAYAVTYQGNGNTGGNVPANQNKLHDINLTLASNTGGLVKTGYIFMGWNTTAEGTGTDYAAGSTYSTNAHITLYAKWAINSNIVHWNGSTSTAWATAGNWNALPANNTTTNIANFNLATYGGNPVYAPNAGTTSINGITIGSGNGAMTLTTTNLTIGAGRLAIANGAGAFTISGRTTVGATQNWTNDDNDTATFGIVTLSNALSLSGTGKFLFNGNNNTSGVADVTVNSGATLEIGPTGKLYNSDKSTGQITVGSGATLRLNSWGYNEAGAIGTMYYDRARLVVNDGILEYAGNSSGSGRNFTVGGNGATLRASSGAGQTWSLNAETAFGNLQVNSGRTLTLDGAGSGIINRIIENTTGTGNLAKAGTGTWTLTAANTYAGTTTIGAGTLSAGNIVVSGGSSNLGNASTAVTLGSASAQGTLSYTGNSATYTRGFTIGGAGGGRLDVTTSGQTLTVGTGGVTGSGLFTVGGAGNTTISASLTHTGGLTKEGSGNLTLTAANTYTGATAIHSGTLALTGVTQATTAITFTGGSLGLDTGFPVTASSAAVDLTNGTIQVTGGTGAASYTLLTAASITGTPTLASPISGYELQVIGGNQLRLVQLSLFQIWAAASSLSGGNATSGADPDGDGWNNLQEFAFGTLPNSAVSGPLEFTPGAEVTKTGSPVLRGYTPPQGSPPFQAVFGRRKNHVAAGLTYTAEFSANLIYWTPSNFGSTVLTGSGSHEIEVVAVPFPENVPLSEGGTEIPPKFFRIAISQN